MLRDQAFSFYYPENLVALEDAGATLVPFSPIRDETVPDIDALYGGGGFPERYAAELSANESLRACLARRIAGGMPVWAECGALMYLSLAIVRDGRSYPMVGALPAVVEHRRAREATATSKPMSMVTTRFSRGGSALAAMSSTTRRWSTRPARSGRCCLSREAPASVAVAMVCS